MIHVTIATPTAPPPDIVSDIGDEDINDGNVPETAADTNQLVGWITFKSYNFSKS